jgi:5-methylcytosine-specific restriction protein A
MTFDRPATRFHGTREWRRIADAFRARQRGICAACGAGGATHVDHIRPLAEGGGNGFSNLQLLCHGCHSRKTARQDGGFGNARGEYVPRTACDAEGRPMSGRHWWNGPEALHEPAGLKRSRPRLTIVCGPPGAGKSFYVRQHIRTRDVLIDLDAIIAEQTGYRERVWSRRLIDAGLAERNRRLAALAEDGAHSGAWFIVTAARGEQRRRWATMLGAVRTIVLLTPRHICIERIKDDPARAKVMGQQLRAVSHWFDSYTPWAGDTPIRQGAQQRGG